FSGLLCPLLCSLFAQPSKSPKTFLITLDGLRWQEVFGGAVDSIMQNKEYTQGQKKIWEAFHADNQKDARKKLMPWFWSTMLLEGQLYGNRWEGSTVNCRNKQHLSYPGYNEMLTGDADPSVDSNARKYNDNVTVLEWLDKTPGFQGKVAAFGSWDVFPYILNDKGSGLAVKGGFMSEEGSALPEAILNTLQQQIPKPWPGVKLDAFTQHYAMEYIRERHPRVVYIGYGENNDATPDSSYDHYLHSVHQIDKFIANIWDFIQTDPFYRNQTTLLITTDHGRGAVPVNHWKSHGPDIEGSDEIWFAAIGPKVTPKGVVKGGPQFYQYQIAATLARSLGLRFEGVTARPGPAMEGVIER
ncbi:MAG: phosphoglyceromutase, partial [Bacteroidota bacterium]